METQTQTRIREYFEDFSEHDERAYAWAHAILGVSGLLCAIFTSTCYSGGLLWALLYYSPVIFVVSALRAAGPPIGHILCGFALFLLVFSFLDPDLGSIRMVWKAEAERNARLESERYLFDGR